MMAMEIIYPARKRTGTSVCIGKAFIQIAAGVGILNHRTEIIIQLLIKGERNNERKQINFINRRQWKSIDYEGNELVFFYSECINGGADILQTAS